MGLKNEYEILNYYVTTGKAAGHKGAAEVITLNNGIVYHTVSNVAAVAPTCTAVGKTGGKKCATCGITLSGLQEVAATGHSYGSGKITTQPTCTGAGVKTYTCANCNTTKTEALDAKGHTEVTDKAVAATCTTVGKTEGTHCSVCNAVLVAQEEIPALGDGYVLLNPQLTNCGYWNSTHSSYYNTIIKNAASSKNYCATVRFTKEQLPVGSIIVLENGWQYRPEGWVTESVQTTREDSTTLV